MTCISCSSELRLRGEDQTGQWRRTAASSRRRRVGNTSCLFQL